MITGNGRITVVLLLLALNFTNAQDNSTAQSDGLSGSLCLKTTFSGGFGYESFDLFKTSENDIVTLSPGGGGGFHFFLDYYLTDRLLAEIGIGYQESMLSQELSNADAFFDRLIFSGGCQYRLPITKTGYLLTGGGIGLFTEAVFDIDAAELEDGAHNIYYYSPTVGLHLQVDYGQPIPTISWLTRKWDWNIGLRVSVVNYDLDYATTNGNKIAINEIPDEILRDMKTLNGGGVDIFFSLIAR